MSDRQRAPGGGPTGRPVIRAVLASLVLGVVATGSVVFSGQPAQATSFRFWSYWLGAEGSWSFAAQGAARVPADGTVDGWRFAISAATGSSTPPRARPAFGALCGDTQPVAGSKRVGLVVDFGQDDEAPPGESPPGVTLARCVVVPVSATGYDVLAAAALPLRLKGGLVCGIGGYPATGCGEAVREPDPSGGGSGGGNGSSTGGSGGSGAPDGGAAGRGNASGTGDAPATPGPGSGASSAAPGPQKSASTASTPTPRESSASAPPTVAALPAAEAGGGEPAAGAPGPSSALWAGLAAVLGLLVAAVAVSRRRR